MKIKDTKIYTSAESYLQGPDNMKNEVTMWFVAAGSLLQYLSCQNKNLPFGGLHKKIGVKENLKLRTVKILDLCSGPGNFINHLQFVYPKIKATCVDINKIFIKTGKKRLPDLIWRLGNATSINLKTKFDIITMSSAYHHIPDKDKKIFLQNAKRHLTPNGIIVVCENFLPNYNNSQDRAVAIENYYSELKKYYLSGNATPEAIKLIEEVYQLERCGVEEHKVCYRIFRNTIKKMDLLIDQDVVVWQPKIFRHDNAGSHVIILKTR